MTRFAFRRPAMIRLAVAGVVAVGISAAVIAAELAGWWPNLVLVGGAVVVMAVIWLVLRQPNPTAVVLIAGLCQVPGLLATPITSTDAYRYVWDGRVQLAGHSPYAHVPFSDELSRLRDPILFPGLGPDDRTGVTGVPADAPPTDDPRTKINRPLVPTIYPPGAQLYFTTVAAVTPWSAGTLGLQLAAAALAVAVTALLAGRQPRWAAIWGWSPLVTLEAANAAHVDVLATLLILLALTRRRGAGILLGAAAAVKLIPLLLLPVLLWKRAFIAFGTFLTGYLPHVVVAGALVLGFLPGYLDQEGFADGTSRSAILALVLPPDARQLAALVLAVALAVVAAHRRADLVTTACWLYGAALLIATPTYPWYGLPLLALAVLARRLEWIAVVLAAYLAYASYGHEARQSLIYLCALAVVVLVQLKRTA